MRHYFQKYFEQYHIGAECIQYMQFESATRKELLVFASYLRDKIEFISLLRKMQIHFFLWVNSKYTYKHCKKLFATKIIHTVTAGWRKNF